jgi:hypothetical protein
VVIVKLAEFEVAPSGSCTTTEAVPTEAIRLADTAAVNCVGETNVALSAAPFHKTLSPLTKLLPFTVSVKPEPPATTLDGEIVVIDGVAAVIVKLAEFEVAPPGACTLTDVVSVAETRVEETVAVSWLADTNAVLRAEPFHKTLSPLTKLLPFTISVKPELPATTLDGEIVVIDGVAAVIAKLKEFEAAPPGACTLTDAVPVVAIRIEETVAVNRLAER